MKKALRILAVLALIVLALGLWQREKLTRLHAVLTLFAPEKIVTNFSNMDAAFEHTALPVTTTAKPLPIGASAPLPADWDAWLERRAVTGIVVLSNGEIVHESYHKGTARDDLRISWSMAKSYVSALIGVLAEDGTLPDLDAQVVAYVPGLKGSAYEGVSIRNVLQMSSGVEFDEDYLDFWSDINRMGRVLALGRSMDDFAAGLTERNQEPGERWQYVSIDTHILAMVARAATGQSLSELIATRLLEPMGVIGAPYFVTDGEETAFALGGLNMTTRDYARFGEMFRQGGQYDGTRIVPADWARESTTPSAKTAAGKIQYGYQWWIASDARAREYFARGVYGQYIYINEPAGLVIAVNGADLTFREAGAFDDALQMFRALADTLGGQGA